MDISKRIFLNENVWIWIKFSPKLIIWTNDGWITYAYMRHSTLKS